MTTRGTATARGRPDLDPRRGPGGSMLSLWYWTSPQRRRRQAIGSAEEGGARCVGAQRRLSTLMHPHISLTRRALVLRDDYRL